jgi:hypothetical protein
MQKIRFGAISALTTLALAATMATAGTVRPSEGARWCRPARATPSRPTPTRSSSSTPPRPGRRAGQILYHGGP